MRERKHICFINPYFGSFFNPQLDIAGGAETQLLGFAKHLVSRNQKISIVTDFRKERPKYLSRDNIHWFSTPFKYLGGSNIHLIQNWFRLVILILKIRPDVIVLKHPRHLIFLLGIISAIGRIRLFFFAAIDKDVAPQLLDNEPKLSRFLYQFGLKLLDGVIAQTIHQKNAFRSLTNANVYYLPSIYSDLILKGTVNTVKGKFVLWVGSNSLRKRPHIFKEIAIKHPHLKFVMIYSKGDGTGGIDEKFGPSNLTYIPSCPREIIGRYYKQSLFVVSTSKLEGFPNIFLESWFFKKPILSLEIDPDGIISKNKLGIVARDLTSFYREFEHLIGNETLRNQLGQNGRNYLDAVHDPDKVIKEFLKIINN